MITTIEGTNYILAASTNGRQKTECVLRYLDSEMSGEFTADQVRSLQAGFTVTKQSHGFHTTYIDMVAASRRSMAQQA